MELNWIEIATLAVVATIFAVQIYRRVRNEDVLTVEDIGEVIDLAGNIWGDAREYAAAAEQLWLSGRIEKDSKFKYVFEAIHDRYPHVTTQQLEAAVEAAVYWLNQTKARDAK